MDTKTLKKKKDEIKEYCAKFNNKLKALILLSSYQNSIFQNHNKEEEVFFINKKYLGYLYYDELNSIIIKNKKILKYLNFFQILNSPLNLIYKIISKSDKLDEKRILKINIHINCKAILIMNSSFQEL